MSRGNYGVDAPYAPAIFGLVALGAWGAVAYLVSQGELRVASRLVLFALFFSMNAGSYLYTTRRGKFREWDRILDGLALRGDEQVLDMGCGRGAVMIAVAHRLGAGRVTGVDIWSKVDQSGNARDVTLRNAALEGVAERVQVETGDMRALPFLDASFDLVVSSLAIHNIPSGSDRAKAVAEGYRVLKPGGRIVIADIRATGRYQAVLRALGAVSVERRRLGWRFWWGNPFAATRLLTATKRQPD